MEPGREWTATDFVGFFPKTGGKAGATNSGSDSYDSMITDFEAERAASEVSAKDPCDEEAWAPLLFIMGQQAAASPAEEAAHLLIGNHAAVLADVTRTDPVSQRDLKRVQPSLSPFVDEALREVARRLLRHRKKLPPAEQLNVMNLVRVAAWSNTATYLSGRIQSTRE